MRDNIYNDLINGEKYTFFIRKTYYKEHSKLRKKTQKDIFTKLVGF